jgi:hypothetical protein
MTKIVPVPVPVPDWVGGVIVKSAIGYGNGYGYGHGCNAVVVLKGLAA